MTTYKRICLEDICIRDQSGNECVLKRGQEYLTSAVDDAPAIGPDAEKGNVIVFTNYWVPVPVRYFAGEVKFT